MPSGLSTTSESFTELAVGAFECLGLGVADSDVALQVVDGVELLRAEGAAGDDLMKPFRPKFTDKNLIWSN
jgi:hypothetical protein